MARRGRRRQHRVAADRRLGAGAARSDLVRPIVAELTGDGVDVVGGPAGVQLGQLEGRRRDALHATAATARPTGVLVTWVVRAAAGRRGRGHRPPRPCRPDRVGRCVFRRDHDLPDRLCRITTYDPVRAERRSATAQLEDEAITIIREVAAECERPVLLFSGGKDSVVMLHLAHRAFWPARIPFPVMHVDTGHNFDEVIEFRDRTVAALRRRARRRVGAATRSTPAGSARTPARGRRATRCRPSRCSTPSPSTASTPCSAAPAATRSGPGPRSASCRTATSSGSGTRRTSAPSCGGSTTPATTAASTCGCSRCRTGPSSTSGGSSPSARSTCRRCTSPTTARCSAATGC